MSDQQKGPTAVTQARSRTAVTLLPPLNTAADHPLQAMASPHHRITALPSSTFNRALRLNNTTDRLLHHNNSNSLATVPPLDIHSNTRTAQDGGRLS